MKWVFLGIFRGKDIKYQWHYFLITVFFKKKAHNYSSLAFSLTISLT